MRRELILAGFILLSSLSSGSIVRFLADQGDIDFLVDAIVVYSVAEGGQRLKVYWEIPYRELLFARADTGYSAHFEMTFIAYDESGNQVGGDSWRRSYNVPSYEATLLETESFRDRFDFPLSNGEYKAKLVIRDLHSANTGVRIMEISVPRIKTESVSLSELLFMKDGAPVLKQNFGPEDRVTVLHEIYNLHLLPGYTLKAIIAVAGMEEMWREVRPIKADSLGMGEWELNFSQLMAGDYQVSISSVSETGELVDEKSRSFHIEISPFVADESFGEMVDELQYIASAEEVKRLKEAKPEAREREWNSFWQEKDPTPSTEINEFKEEYYRRIDYANTHYGGLQKGWRTDRGKAYIVYGPPDEVERHPYELNSMPYEIWYYYSEGLRFIFVDEHGIGNYRLFSPKGERW